MPKRNVYKIIITRNNKQSEYIGTYLTAKGANKKFHELTTQSNNVKFPLFFINIGRHIEPSQYNVVILKKRDEGESKTTLLRNNYGSYVEHETSSENWIVYDKAPYYKEETFWVYGFSPFVQRKTFDFIYNEVLKPKANSKYSILSIYVYKNKLVMDNLEQTELITCKNKEDSIRLHNMLQTYATKDKLKYVLFNGDWSHGDKAKAAEKKIQELTNWTLLKIKRATTRP